MAVWLIVLSVLAPSLFPGPPAVEVATLKGERHAGELLEVTAGAVVLKQGADSLKVPLADLLEVRFPAAQPPEPADGPRLALVDGSRLALKDFSVANDEARCETAFGSFRVPISRVAHVRFGASTGKLDEAWDALLARESKKDLLVVKKDDVLDFLAGATGDVGEKITFLLDGDEVPVAREKVYGIILHRRVPNLNKPLCELHLAGGGVTKASRCVLEGSELKVRLVAGADLALPLALVSSIDFSSGKVVYVSQLEPRDVKYVPFFDIVYEYRRDRSLDGPLLTLGGKSYSRGLAIHSKTTLRYRIAGDYTRFQGLAGIDDTVRRLEQSVQLTITGDNKPLFDAEIKGGQPPQVLDLDVTDVRDLEIVVDFGSDMLDIGDHLDLADARLIK